MAVSAMRWDVTVFLRGTGYVGTDGLYDVFELVSVSSATRFDRGLSLVVR